MGWAPKRRLVRLHLDREPSTLEGFLVGRVNGHYRLAQPKVVQGENQTHDIAGEVHIPRDRVVLVQVMP